MGFTPQDRSLLWDLALLRKVISDFDGGGRVTSGRRSESLLITPNAFELKYSNCSNELRSKLQSIAFTKSRTI